MPNRHLKLVLFAAALTLLLVHVALFWIAGGKALKGYADFAFIYAAAELIKDGSGTHLYDYDAQKRVQDRLFSEVEIRKGTLVFNHLPVEALLFVPFSYLPFAWAYGLWAVINVSILFGLPFLLAPHDSNLKEIFRPFLSLFFVAFFPCFVAVLQGQISILLLLLFALAFLSLKQGRDFLAGCLLGLTLFKFQIVLPFMLPFCLKKRWKVLFGFLVVTSGLVLLSLSLVGWKGMTAYLHLLWRENQNLVSRGQQQIYAIYPQAMPNIRGFLYGACAGKIPEAGIGIGVVGSSLILLLWSAIRWIRFRERQVVDLSFSLNLLVALLVSYHLLLHDLSLLSLPLLLLLNHRVGTRTPSRLLRYASLVVIGIFFLTPLYLTLMRDEHLYLLFWPLLLLTFVVARELSNLKSQGALDDCPV